jgi:hypothetical protein
VEQNQAPAEAPAEQTQSEAAPQEQSSNQKVVDKAKEAGLDLGSQVELVVNGRKIKMPLKDAISQAQRNLAADDKFREAAAARKEIEELKKKAKTSPKALRELIKAVTGEEPTKIFERELAAELEELTLDPREKELRSYKAKIEEYERERQERQEREQAAEQEKARTYWEQKYDKDLSEAIKGSGLPLNEDTIRYAAEIMLTQMEIDPDSDPPMSMVMELVRDRYLKQMSSLTSGLDPEKLLEILGDQGVEKIMKARGKRKLEPSADNQVPAERQEKAEPSRWKSRDEFEAKIKEWASK